MKIRFRLDHRGLHAYDCGRLFVYDRNADPENIVAGENTEVMITGGLPNHPNGFIVRKPQEGERLVQHKGFSLNSHGRVTATSTAELNGRTVTCIIEPGAVDALVPIYGRPEQDHGRPIPGRIWLSRHGNKGLGIPSLTEAIEDNQEHSVYSRMIAARS